MGAAKVFGKQPRAVAQLTQIRCLRAFQESKMHESLVFRFYMQLTSV